MLIVEAFDECYLASKKKLYQKRLYRCLFLLVYHVFAGNVRTSTNWTEVSLQLYEKVQVLHVQAAFVAVPVSLNLKRGTTVDCDLLDLPRTDGFSRCYYRTAQIKRAVAYRNARTGVYLIAEMEKSQDVP